MKRGDFGFFFFEKLGRSYQKRDFGSLVGEWQLLWASEVYLSLNSLFKFIACNKIFFSTNELDFFVPNNVEKVMEANNNFNLTKRFFKIP